MLTAEARHLSVDTLIDYSRTFRKFQDFLEEDVPIAKIIRQQIEVFLRVQQVSKKTLLNYHIGLSALWTRAVGEELVATSIVHRVERA